MKNLLDFFEEDMLYSADSAQARRFDRSLIQSDQAIMVHVGDLADVLTKAENAEARFRNHPTDKAIRTCHSN